MTKTKKYRRTITFIKKTKQGTFGPVNYAVLKKDDRDYIGNIINELVNATECDLPMLNVFLVSAHLGTYKDNTGAKHDKLWWDLLVGLKKKYEAKMPDGTPQDFSEEQLNQLNKMLSHFGLDNIKFESQEMTFKLDKTTLNELFDIK